MSEPTVVKLKKKDFESDQDVRWCPGCGDYAILAAIQRTMPEIGVPKEKMAFISGFMKGSPPVKPISSVPSRCWAISSRACSSDVPG